MVTYNYGTDIESSLSFTNGDLNIVTYENNISQAIMNRLNTQYDVLNLFYVGYGSFLMNFLGWRKRDKTLKFMKLEIEKCLLKDPRINNLNVDLEYSDEGNVKIYIRLYNNNEVLDLNFILNENGVSEV